MMLVSQKYHTNAALLGNTLQVIHILYIVTMCKPFKHLLSADLQTDSFTHSLMTTMITLCGNWIPKLYVLLCAVRFSLFIHVLSVQWWNAIISALIFRFTCLMLFVTWSRISLVRHFMCNIASLCSGSRQQFINVENRPFLKIFEWICRIYWRIPLKTESYKYNI